MICQSVQPCITECSDIGHQRQSYCQAQWCFSLSPTPSIYNPHKGNSLRNPRLNFPAAVFITGVQSVCLTCHFCDPVIHTLHTNSVDTALHSDLNFVVYKERSSDGRRSNFQSFPQINLHQPRPGVAVTHIEHFQGKRLTKSVFFHPRFVPGFHKLVLVRVTLAVSF